MTKITIMPLNIKDRENIVEVLFAAFEQDPLMYYIFGNKYQDLAKYVMQYICDLAHLSNWSVLGAFMGAELKGVAIVSPPEAIAPNKQEAIALDEKLAIAVGEDVIVKIETYFQIKEANKPKQPHFYLDVLGVMPDSQGQGMGKALIKALHKMSEEFPQPCGVALDTENERNLDFYRGMGYSVSTITNLERLQIWSMFRSKTV